MISDERHDILVETIQDGLITCHVWDPEYNFMFGGAYDEDGNLIAHQFEKDRDRIQLHA